MKKYIILSFVLLLAVSKPVLAKNGEAVKTQLKSQEEPAKAVEVKEPQQVRAIMTPTEEEMAVGKTKIEIIKDVGESLNQVSGQVRNLIETVGAKGGIGDQVREIAQNQEKLQDKIKLNYDEIKNRGSLVRLFVGTDKKMVQALEQVSEENKVTIQKLEELKNEAENGGDAQKIQETINLLIAQNTALEEKIKTEKQETGIVGWFQRLFSRQ